MIAVAWETGHTVLVALAWMVLALSIAAGVVTAGLGLGVAWAWRWLRRRAATGPGRALDGPLTPDLRSRVPVEPETAERRPETQPRKEAA